MVPVPYSVISGSLFALGVHLKVHKLFNRLLKRCVKRIFKKNKHDCYNIKSKVKTQRIFSEVRKRMRAHSCPLPQNRRNRVEVVDAWYRRETQMNEIQIFENRGFLRKDHSLFTDRRPSIRSDQEEAIESQAFENSPPDRVIDFQAAIKLEQERVIDAQILSTMDQDQAMDSNVYIGWDQVVETFTSDQHQVFDSLDVTRHEQEQVINSQESARHSPDQAVDFQIFPSTQIIIPQVPLLLEDVSNHSIPYSQPFQLQSNNCSDSNLSTLTKETDDHFTSLNPFLVAETNNYLTPNFDTFQEDTNSPSSASLDSTEDETEESLATNLHQLQVEINNNLAVHLYTIFTEEEKNNILFSPFSISTFIGILLCNDVEEDYVFEKPMSVYSTISQFNTLQFVNAILVQKGFEVKQGHKEILADFFKTLLLEVDFLSGENEEAVTCINEWMDKRTNGIIPMMVEFLNLSTILYNAAYFIATWVHPFDKTLTSLQIFYNCGVKGDTKIIDMMFKTEDYPFYEDDELQVLELPYNEEKVSMLILLPRAKGGLKLVEANLTSSFIQDLKQKLQKTRVHVALPRFRLEFTKRLEPYLHQLICDFAPEANSGIACTSPDVTASGTLHKAVLKINENGCNVEAKATEATSKMDYFLGLHPEFVADHPFVFVVFDKKKRCYPFNGKS